MRLRGNFENKDHAFQPGMFVRVRLPLGKAHEALLIAEQAIGSDQGRPFVYVLDENNEVVYRRIETGAMHGGLREIKESTSEADKGEGLRKGDRVILNGLQRLRPGVKVEPQVVPMPNPRAVAASNGRKGRV